MNRLLKARLEKSANVILQNDRLQWILREQDVLRVARICLTAADEGEIHPESVSESARQSLGIAKNLRGEIYQYLIDSLGYTARAMDFGKHDQKAISEVVSTQDPGGDRLLSIFEKSGRISESNLNKAMNDQKALKKLRLFDAFSGNSANMTEFYQKVVNLASLLSKIQNPKFIMRAKQDSNTFQEFTQTVVMTLDILKEVRKFRTDLRGKTPDQKVIEKMQSLVRKKIVKDNRESTDPSRHEEEGVKSVVRQLQATEDEIEPLVKSARKHMLAKAKEIYGSDEKELYELIKRHVKGIYSPSMPSEETKTISTDKSVYENYKYMIMPPRVKKDGTLLAARDLMRSHEGKTLYKAYRSYLIVARALDMVNYISTLWTTLSDDKKEEALEKIQKFPKLVRSHVSHIDTLLGEAAPLELTRKKNKEEVKEEKKEESVPLEEKLKAEEESNFKPHGKREKEKETGEEPETHNPRYEMTDKVQDKVPGVDVVKSIERQMDEIETDVQDDVETMMSYLVNKASKYYKSDDFDLKEVLKDNIEDFYSGGIVGSDLSTAKSQPYRDAVQMKNTMETFDFAEFTSSSVGKTIARMYRTVVVSARVLGVLQYLGDRPTLLAKSPRARKDIIVVRKKLKEKKQEFKALQQKLIRTRPAQGNGERREKGENLKKEQAQATNAK